MFLGQHEKEVFVFLPCFCVACVHIVACVHREDNGWGANTFYTGDFGEGGAKDQECAGQRKGLSASITALILF